MLKVFHVNKYIKTFFDGFNIEFGSKLASLGFLEVEKKSGIFPLMNSLYIIHAFNVLSSAGESHMHAFIFVRNKNECDT